MRPGVTICRKNIFRLGIVAGARAILTEAAKGDAAPKSVLAHEPAARFFVSLLSSKAYIDVKSWRDGVIVGCVY